ncbi:hypothetical protein [Streptomyces sp. NPDC086519]|uniref:hypothetical protein n=1 Tax=Streptomyces sp. NPDC086519 TaxID=3154863 RepID=UPI00341ECABB
MDVTSDNPWAGTGLDALGGRVLEYLVGHANASSLTVAAAVGAPLEDVETALRSLEDALLVIPRRRPAPAVEGRPATSLPGLPAGPQAR